jgi:hypothetical protein
MAFHDEPAIARVHGLISTYGFAVVPVGHSSCASPACGAGPAPHPWTYTVGLMATMQPELVVMGLCPVDATHLVHRVVDLRRRGLVPPVDPGSSDPAHDPRHDPRHDVLEVDGLPVRLRPVPDEWLQYDPSRMAAWFAWNRDRRHRFGELPVVQQILWADDHGAFPEDPSCEWHVVEQQPLLDVDPFSFPEPVRRPVAPVRPAA